MPDFVKVVDKQQKDETTTTSQKDLKVSTQLNEIVKQTQPKTPTEIPSKSEISPNQKEKIQQEQTKILSQLVTKSEDKKSSDQEQIKNLSSQKSESTDSDNSKTEQIKTTQINSFEQNIKTMPDIQKSVAKTHQDNQQNQQITKKENIQTNQQNSIQQFVKKTNESIQKDRLTNESLQITDQKNAKESTPVQKQLGDTSNSNIQKQNNSQMTLNNKSNQNVSNTITEQNNTQRQINKTVSVSDKTIVNIEQTNLPPQTNYTGFVIPQTKTQSTTQFISQKINTLQENSEIKVIDDKPHKTILNQTTKNQTDTDVKSQSSSTTTQEQNIESSKMSINMIQSSKDTDTKLNKTNLKSDQAIAQTQSQQKIALSRDIVDYLANQSQVDTQSVSENLERMKDKPIQKISQQTAILAENIVSNKTSEQSSTQTNTITLKQAQVIIRNALVQIQDSTSEFTQFKQIKRELPDQLKTSQPIKIENFKLEIARDLKKESPQVIQQPQMEKMEQTEQVKELLNTKLARKTYENEQPVQSHQEFQKNIDSVIVRVEQEQRSSNIQTIVDTIKQMQDNFTEKATVDLSPPNLGKVEIEIVKQQDKLMITLKVATDETKEILEKSSKDLVSRLNTLGFKIEQVEVKTPQKLEEDQLTKDQGQDHHQNERRHKKQQEEVNEDDQRD